MMREAWTDERLDDLKAGMHREFDQVHREFDQVHTDIRELRSDMNARFDSMQRTMVLGFVSIIATLVGAIFAKGLF